jgi:hypothetical protein
MTGALLNTATVLLGASTGLLLKSKLPERAQRIIMRVLGVVTLCLGAKMVLETRNIPVLVSALVLGVAVGTVLKIQQRLESATQRLLQRFSKPGEPNKIAEGFLDTSLLFCIGPMTVLGSIQDGLSGDCKLIAIKSALDGVASVGFAASMGWGVLLSAVSVLVVQGSITLGASGLQEYFTPPLVAEFSATGGALVICIGITLTGIRKLPVADYLPAIVFAPLLSLALPRFPF